MLLKDSAIRLKPEGHLLNVTSLAILSTSTTVENSLTVILEVLHSIHKLIFHLANIYFAYLW